MRIIKPTIITILLFLTALTQNIMAPPPVSCPAVINVTKIFIMNPVKQVLSSDPFDKSLTTQLAARL